MRNSYAKTLGEIKREYRQEYALSRPSRFKRHRPGVTSSPTSGDYHIRSAEEYFRGIEYVRDMHRNDGVIKMLTTRSRTMQVQTGFSYDPKTGDRALDKALKEDHDEWWYDANRYDIAGEYSGPEAEKQAFEGMLRDGDFSAVGLDTMHLQFHLAHRLRTPTWGKKASSHLGVTCNQQMRRTHYTFVNGEKNRVFENLLARDTTTYDTWVDNDAGIRQVFHVYHVDRCDMTRGITAYHPMVEYSGMFEDINFALLVKQQLAAFLGLSVEMADKNGVNDPESIGQNDSDVRGELEQKVDQMRPGMVLYPKAGKTAKILSANVPSNETMAHLKFILTILSLNLGLPLVTAWMDASETNFSGWKGANEVAQVGWISNQESFEERWHRPQTKWRIWMRLQEENTALGKMLRAARDKGINVFKHEWHKPRWKSVQPVEAATAKILRISSNLNSRRRELAEDGLDIDDTDAETVNDFGRLIWRAHRKAQKLVEKGVEGVTWRDVLQRDLPKGISLKLGDESKDETSKSKSDSAK